MDAVAVVQRQLDAYNARDLAAFVACYRDDVRVYRPPAPEPALAGKPAFAEFYRTQRFSLPAPRASSRRKRRNASVVSGRASSRCRSAMNSVVMRAF